MRFVLGVAAGIGISRRSQAGQRQSLLERED
jgi:hypothetical protein